MVDRNCNAIDPLTAPRHSPCRSHRAKHRNSVADFCAGASPGQPEAPPQTPPRGSAPLGTPPGSKGPEPGRFAPHRRVVTSGTRIQTRFAAPVNHGWPELQRGEAAVGTGTLPVWGSGAKRPGRRRQPAGGTTSSQTESKIRTGSTHGLLRERAKRPRPGRGALPPVCNIDGSHFSNVRGSGQSWLTEIATQ